MSLNFNSVEVQMRRSTRIRALAPAAPFERYMLQAQRSRTDRSCSLWIRRNRWLIGDV